jgi:hypothetical protein
MSVVRSTAQPSCPADTLPAPSCAGPTRPTGPSGPAAARLSRRRLCGGALALLGTAGVVLVGGCSGDDPAGEAQPRDPGADDPPRGDSGGEVDDGAVGDGAAGPASGEPGGGDAGETGGTGQTGSVVDPEAVGEGTPVMYASPTCGCCRQYAEYLRDNGHSVEPRYVDDLADIKDSAGVPAAVESCHTTLIGGYVVEGHVPVEAIDKLLRERPGIDGIALPDMPAGSPGMGGTKTGPFEIRSFTGGTVDPEPYLVV